MRIGICEAAARWPRRITRSIAGLLVMMSLEGEGAGDAPLHAGDLALERAELEGVLDRDLQAFGRDRLDDEIDRAGPHGADDRVDAAMGGLHDDRDGAVELAELGEHRHAVEIGHDEIEDDQRKGLAVGPGQPGDRLLAAGSGGGAVPEPLDSGAEQPALHGIIVDDEDGYRHVLNCKAPFQRCGDRIPPRRTT